MYQTGLNIKGRLKNNFQTTSFYKKQPACSKIEVQAAFVHIKKQPALRKIKVQAAFSALRPFGRRSRIFQSIFRQPLTCNEI